MGKETDLLCAQITRDDSPEPLRYTISRGTTSNQTKFPFGSLPTPTFSNFRMDSPTYAQSCDYSSDTSSSPGSWMDQPVDEDYLPLQVKDPKLQAYFFLMEKTLRTCHPAAVQTEAAKLTRDIVAKPADVETSIQAVAETLVRAGCRKVEYSRSCALVAREIFNELRLTSLDASDSLRSCLIDATMTVFDRHYFKVNLWHLGGLNGLSGVEEEMINVAAFAGDLFALDLLPVQTVEDRVLANLAYANQVSTIHCRALHLFLLHAKAHGGPSIGLEALSHARRQLVRCIRGPPMAYDRMAQLWVIECCAVIDKAVEQERLACRWGSRPAVVSHQRDKVLSKQGWFSALTS